MSKHDAENRSLFFSALRWLKGGITTPAEKPLETTENQKIKNSTLPEEAPASKEKKLSKEVLLINKDPTIRNRR